MQQATSDSFYPSHFSFNDMLFQKKATMQEKRSTFTYVARTLQNVNGCVRFSKNSVLLENQTRV